MKKGLPTRATLRKTSLNRGEFGMKMLPASSASMKTILAAQHSRFAIGGPSHFRSTCRQQIKN
jgi:hypothetical protein